MMISLRVPRFHVHKTQNWCQRRDDGSCSSSANAASDMLGKGLGVPRDFHSEPQSQSPEVGSYREDPGMQQYSSCCPRNELFSQNFSDDEGQVDEPLAPLPDEPEIVEGDDDEQDDNPVAPEVETTVVLDSGAVTQEPTEVDPVSKPPSPKAELLMTSTMDEDIPTDGLDLSLKSLDEGGIELVEGDDTKLNEDVGMELDISALGPDGLGLEASNDLSQLEPEDAILGGPLLDDTPDPFADNIS